MPSKKTLNPDYVSNAQAAALALNIPIDHIKACRKLECPSAQGRYYIKQLAVWYEAHKQDVLEYLEDNNSSDNDNWKSRKERAQALIAEMDLKDREGKTLNKDKVIMTLKSIVDAQSIMLRVRQQELPLRLIGKDIPSMQKELMYSDEKFLSLLKTQIDKWIKDGELS